MENETDAKMADTQLVSRFAELLSASGGAPLTLRQVGTILNTPEDVLQQALQLPQLSDQVDYDATRRTVCLHRSGKANDEAHTQAAQQATSRADPTPLPPSPGAAEPAETAQPTTAAAAANGSATMSVPTERRSSRPGEAYNYSLSSTSAAGSGPTGTVASMNTVTAAAGVAGVKGLHQHTVLGGSFTDSAPHTRYRHASTSAHGAHTQRGGYRSDSFGGGGALRRRGAVRKPGALRPSALDEGQAFFDGQVGRVGYVCVADELRLSDIEAHYRSLGYFTKSDFDVLHIRFADAEMQNKAAGGFHGAGDDASSGADGGGYRTYSYGATGVTSATTSTGGGAKLPRPSGSPTSGSALGKPLPGSPTTATTTGPTGSPTSSRRTGFDLFVFAYGAVVWWGFDQRFFKIVENDFMLPDSAIAKYMVNRYPTQMVNENYPVWCTYTLARKETADAEADDEFLQRLRFDHFLIPYSREDINTCTISMLCASHALAQSAKIDYLEIKVQELTESCSPLPRELREKGRATITERRLLQLRGEVLSYRLMLKSGSDLLDEPDLFWENAYLKPIFEATKEVFEISERVEALDNKLDAANEILSMLAEEFSQRHGARLEWIVIWLVFVEVIIGVMELMVDMRPWFYRRG